MIRIQRIASNISGCDAEDWNTGGLCHLLFQAVQMGVNGFRLPSRVGENRVADFGEDAFG